MKVGVNLINFGPGARPDALRRWVEVVEALGYHLMMSSDHIAITPDVQSRYPAPFFEPFSTLGWMAGISRQMEIGATVIIVPYRHPLETARWGANVDQLSSGRFILGVGVGWATQEFEALGVPFHRRGAMTDEYLDAIKTLWTQERATFKGQYVSFEDVYTAPGPVQSPHPPIWVGGNSDAALRRAVVRGDAWHPIRIRAPEFESVSLPRLQAIADAEQRPLPALCPRIRLRLTDSPLPESDRVAGEGSLDQVRRDLEALERLGCAYVVLDTYYDDVDATANHETAWRMLSRLAEKAFDLAHESLKS